MSRIAYDFLNDSFLFRRDLLEKSFEGTTDKDLDKELRNYRDHLLKRASEIGAEISPHRQDPLSVYFDTSARSAPPIELLRQCALYYDRAFIDDPLFELTRPTPNTSEAVGRYLGLSSSEINRERIANAAQFMLDVRPMVAAGFLNFLPISLVHEPPAQTPITYSANLYAERIPESLREWFHHNAIVHPLRRGDNSWYFRQDEPLTPTRGICVEFPGYPQKFIYHLFAMKKVADKGDGIFEVRQWLPDEPPSQDSFDIWVRQSINQAGGNVFSHTSTDMAYAGETSSMLLTNSKFVADMLALQLGTSGDLREDVASLMFKLELPILERISIQQLMTIRTSEGIAFKSFRTALEAKLRELRLENDEGALQVKLQNIQHELTEVQVREIDREVRRLKREILGSALVGAASLATIVPSGGASLATFIGGAIGACKASVAYINKVREHPAFFLWRLQTKARQ